MNAAEYLRKLMSGHGLTSYRLAEAAGGAVGESTVRNYLSGQGRPRAEKALAIARVFGTEQGTQLLTLWGYEDLGESFAEGLEELPIREYGSNSLMYSGKKLAVSGERKARDYIAFLQSQGG